MNVPSKPAAEKDALCHPDRTERLAAALRENLRRRKAQARAQNSLKQDVAKPESPPDKSPRE